MIKPSTRYKTVKRYNIPGHAHFLTFSCYRRIPLLVEEQWLSWLAESVRDACNKYRTALWAYVFMPDHVHMLVRPTTEDHRIQDFLKAAKQPVATRILNSLKKNDSPLVHELRLNTVRLQGRHRVWQAGGGYDYNVWSIDKVIEKARYCHRNPVIRGFVEDPAD